MIRVVITDDHPMITSGLKNSLREAENIEVTAAYNSATSLLENINNLQADVLILDMQLADGNGYDVAMAIMKIHPKIGILIFSNNDSIYQVKKMQEAGCLGYLLKNADNNLIFKAIGAVYEGYRFLSPELEKALLADMFAGKQDKHKKVTLSKREIEILKLIVKEYTTQQIAAALFLTVSAIEYHRSNLFQKLDVKSSAGLVRVALQNNLI